MLIDVKIRTLNLPSSINLIIAKNELSDNMPN